MIKDLLSRLWKKSDNPYPKSFGKSLTRRIMLRMLIFMGITMSILFAGGYLMTNGFTVIVLLQLTKGQNEGVRRITSEVMVAAQNTAPFIEENLDNPDKLYDIMERMVRTNERIRSCGVSFVDNYYPAKGHWFCPYAVRRDSMTIERLTIGNKQHDYLQADWFVEALQKDTSYWSSPFFEGTDKTTPLVSYIVPIHNRQQQLVAILGVDLSLDGLCESAGALIDDSEIESEDESSDDINDSYFFVVDTTGTFLAHPDKQRLINKKFQDYITNDPNNIFKDKILKRKYGIGDNLEIENTEVLINYRPIEGTPWIVGMVVRDLYLEILSCAFAGIGLIFMIISMMVVIITARRAITKASLPIRLLAFSANDVAKGNFKAALPQLKSRDEIHLLRDSFEKMEQSLAEYTEQLTKTTAEKATIESELNIAHAIQMSMLPKTFPPYPERNDVDIYGQVTPAKAVGGDLFDFYIRDEKLFFCIGDVSGKGVPASMFMAVARSLFRNISAHVPEPNIIAKALNESMSESNEMNMFVTMFIGVLDLQTGVLRYCNAGHDAPLLIGQGVGVLPCDANLPIGVMDDWDFTVQETIIAPQTTIFLFTDGLNEAENALHQQFGDEQVLSLAKELLAKGQNQPMPFVQRMTAAVHFFAGAAEQSDDLTMLAIQYKKES
ncbi:MAG: SpoIIE family protein phosphatase [Prevotella sp.]|nr:SpoIIE family protein phosphatase [Prevotella sp.]